ncbi:MAG: DUF3144 domain-containing protein [Rhodospirillales bacterium]
MSEEEDRHTLSIQLANQIINTANNRLQEGMEPADVAAGMRHAAANFTAFAIANSEAPDQVDPQYFAEEFLQIYNYYLEKHTAPQQVQTGLEALIKQVRDEN